MLTRLALPISSLLLLLTLPGCDSGSAPTDAELYAAAVEDAEVVTIDEVVDDLVAIRPENTDLMRDPDGRVLMITWTSYDGYDGMEGASMPLGVEVWTTAAPQLQDFCRATGLQGEALSLRLEQLLGVPPGDGKTRMVSLWVPPEGLFRPSPDPEIDDSTAQLDFPPDVDPAHKQWIEDLRASSYVAPGYPWTQLGYTYDWSPDAESVEGLSEFVARAGTEVVVEQVVSQDEYCR